MFPICSISKNTNESLDSYSLVTILAQIPWYWTDHEYLNSVSTWASSPRFNAYNKQEKEEERLLYIQCQKWQEDNHQVGRLLGGQDTYSWTEVEDSWLKANWWRKQGLLEKCYDDVEESY